MISEGDKVKYRVGTSQTPNTVGTITYVEDLRVYIDGVPGQRSGISRTFAEIETL